MQLAHGRYSEKQDFRAAVPNPSGTGAGFVEDDFPCMGGGEDGDGSGAHARDGERWGAADEALISRPLLTSCCAAWSATGHGPYRSAAGGLGTPAFEDFSRAAGR